MAKFVKETDIHKKYPLSTQVADIWRYGRHWRFQLVLYFLLMLLAAAVAVVPTWLYGIIIDRLTRGEYNGLYGLVLLIGACYLFLQLLNNLVAYKVKLLVGYIRNEARLLTLHHLFRVKLATFETHPVGKILERLNTGVQGIRETLNTVYRGTMHNTASLIFMGGVLVSVNPAIGIGMIAVVVVFFILASKMLRHELVLQLHVFQANERIAGKVYDFLRHIQIVKYLNAQTHLLRILRSAYNGVLDHERKNRLYERTRVFVNSFWLDLSYSSVLAAVVYFVSQGQMSIGTGVMLIGYSTRMIGSSRMVFDDYQTLQQHRTAMYRLHTLYEFENEKDGVAAFPKAWEELLFDHVIFKYPDKKICALANVTTSIKKGTRVAIVGKTGSGKTTLAKVFMRAREPTEGKVTIGKVCIQDIKSNSFYEHCKVVPQDNELMNATVLANLQLGDNNITSAGAAKALEVASALSFVEALPQGINTLVGPEGIKLSGGEKQRVCLARALVGNPAILVLDEATSHLDVVTERKVFENLRKLPQEMTVIAITHRITSAPAFDRIIVMKKGRIEAEGTHRYLLRHCAYYQTLWQAAKHRTNVS